MAILLLTFRIIRAYIVSPLPTSCGINYVLTNWGEEEIHVKQESMDDYDRRLISCLSIGMVNEVMEKY